MHNVRRGAGFYTSWRLRRAAVLQREERPLSAQRAVERDRVGTSRSQIPEADDVVGKIAGTGAVCVGSAPEEVAVLEGKRLCGQDSIERLGDGRPAEAVRGAKNPDELAQDDIVDV